MTTSARAWLFGFLSFVIGCGSIGSRPDAECGVCPVDFFDLDGDSSTGVCGCEYACRRVSSDDPIDPNFTDANCDGSDGVVASCVFVSASVGSSEGNGDRNDPVDTIAFGIDSAASFGKNAVCVSGELYLEPVDMRSGISVYGGFDHTDTEFAFRRSANSTTVVRAEGTAFLATQIDVETHIEGLEIDALSLAMGPGQSTYGIRLIGGSGVLYVRYNDISASSGLAGTNGLPGAPHGFQSRSTPGEDGSADADIGGAGGVSPNCQAPGGTGGAGGHGFGSGLTGGAGSGNAPAPEGMGGGSDCGNGGNSGQPGTGGATGVAGFGGAGGAVGGAQSGRYAPAAGQVGLAGVVGDGGGGGGGGGGGQAGGLGCMTGDRGGGGGAGGCGGLGGRPGNGATGGGGSFGVFATAQIVIEANTINTGNGGNGGAGGGGGAGQSGALGGFGGTGGDDGGNGGLGGDGGDGGDGGPGGGGGGAPAACIAYLITVDATVSANACSLGAPGAGGLGGMGPGAQAGADGVATEVLLLN